MALYTDPQTGQRRDTGDLSRSPRSTSSSFGIIALLIALALIAWFFYGRVSPTVDRTNTGQSTITEPVTTPSSPNASPTHPAPSPNPGP
ncbi:histone deacetylase [Hyphomicrobium sp.]|uniref:histone deacetylase n=1 Tax=Hyphomicrobium sp. TaxID=82 RepID=UPI002D7915E6|nr:histone deacetylase [Hyphomicrobium sp.]HET6389764.1 histone deacetylase [Hyphomicrobium sp.]